jgi:hypothetical protein
MRQIVYYRSGPCRPDERTQLDSGERFLTFIANDPGYAKVEAAYFELILCWRRWKFHLAY